MKSRYFAIIGFGLLLLAVIGISTSDADSGRYVRLRYLEGDVTVYPSDGQRPNDATVNSPLVDGDVVETGNGRAELAFNNGIMVRIGDYSSVRLDSAYSPMVIELLQGSVFVDSHLIDSFREELEVRAGETQVYLIDEGNLRIDLGSEGSVRVTTVNGEAEVSASGYRVLLQSGERTYVDPGNRPESPSPFESEYDELDDWNASRMQAFSYEDQGDRYVDESLYYDTYDLHQYGDWRAYGTYGNVWVPRVGFGWRPYNDGRWVYSPGGWFWVSYEPWGWAPYHYGRWGWAVDFGWYWIPGYSFAPSWVSWYDYGDYVGWCPLNYYNRPIIIHDGNYYSPVQKQKTLDVSNSWTFVKKHEVGATNVKQVSLPGAQVKKIQMHESKVIHSPQKQLTSYVIPKTVKTPAFVNDKRIAPTKNADIENPYGIKNRQDTIGQQKNSGKQIDSGSSGKKAVPTQSWEKNRPTGGTTKQVVPGTKYTPNSNYGGSKTVSPRENNTGSSNSGGSKYVSPNKNGSPSSNKYSTGGSKQSSGSVNKSTSSSSKSSGNKSSSSSKSGSVSKGSSSSSNDKKPKPPNYNRDDQFERFYPNNSSRFPENGSRSYDRSPYERNMQFRSYDSRPYGSSASPYTRDSSRDSGRVQEQSNPWYREPRSYDRGAEKNRGEVSPRYLDGARKLFERFDDRRYVQEPKSSSPRYESRPESRNYSKSEVRSQQPSVKSQSRSSAPSRQAPSSSGKAIKKKD